MATVIGAGRTGLAHCAANHLILTEELRDSGLSASNAEHLRGHLGRLIQRVIDGEIPPGTTLIVEVLDRLSRQVPRLAQSQFLLLINRGIRIVTLIGEPTIFDSDTLDGNPGLLFLVGRLVDDQPAAGLRQGRRRA